MFLIIFAITIIAITPFLLVLSMIIAIIGLIGVIYEIISNKINKKDLTK